MALLEKAAGQGHVYAMFALAEVHHNREEYAQVVQWCTKAAEAGLPDAMFNLGAFLDKGAVVAPDYPAAAGWFTRAADAGHGDAAVNLSIMYSVGRGWAWQIMPATLDPRSSS